MKRKLVTTALLLVAATIMAQAPASSAGERPTIKVLTFNVWGIVGAKARVKRAEAIGRRIAELDPDVIALEEAFEKRHRKALLESLARSGYRTDHSRYYKNVYGSGLLFISRFPVQEDEFQPYRVIGGWRDIEWLGGKGIAHLELKTPWGPLDFFHTHAIARMTPVFDEQGDYIPGDPKQVDRLLHMYQIDRFVRDKRGPGGRCVIAAGDFNVSPEMLEYQFLIEKTGFENSFDKVHPGGNPSTFSIENVLVKNDYSRIDHVFYKNYDGAEGFWIKPVSSRVEMDSKFEDPKNEKMINYSDHYGLMTEFEVIKEPGRIELSPPGLASSGCACGAGDPPGYMQANIHLTSSNLHQWRHLALAAFEGALEKEERRNKLLIPFARIAVLDDSDLPAEVPLAPGLQRKLERKYGVLSAAPE